MAIVYKKISQLEQLNQPINKEDLMILSRPNKDNDSQYDSYKVTYDKLSGDIYTKIENVLNFEIGYIDKLGKVNDYDDIKQNGKRIVQENVIYTIKQNSGQQDYSKFLDKTINSSQTIVGEVVFQGGLTTPVQPTEDNDVANKYYVDNFADQNVNEMIYINKLGPEIISSFIITSTNGLQDISQGVIYTGNSRPLLFYNDADRLLDIRMCVASGTNIGIFSYNIDYSIYSYEDIWSELQSKKDTTNLNLLYVSSNDRINNTLIPLAKDTYICIYKSITLSNVKKTIDVYGILKNKNKDRISEHLTAAESYSNSNGYSYHYESYVSGKKTKYKVVYDLKDNKKYKLYGIYQKTINCQDFTLGNNKFSNKDSIQFSSYQ